MLSTFSLRQSFHLVNGPLCLAKVARQLSRGEDKDSTCGGLTSSTRLAPLPAWSWSLMISKGVPIGCTPNDDRMHYRAVLVHEIDMY
jgi:hypothetical protein